MADNAELNAGSGGIILATDDILGVHYQIVKITYGALDSQTLVDTTNRFPTSAAQSGTWTVQPGNTANTTAWLVTGTGGTFPVTDSGGSLTVDGTVAVSGSVAVTNGALSVVGGGLEATALRVTIASDSTGVLSVDDNGGSLTVDGTITANLAAGTNNIGDVDILSIAAGDNNIGNVDIVTMPNVTLAAGTNTNEVVGDAAHDSPIAGNPVRIGARALSADFTAVATGDTTDIIASLLGKAVVLPYALPGSTWNYAAASGGIVNTTGVTAKAAAGAGVRNYITHVDVVNGHATVSTDVQIRDGASGTVLWRGFAQAAGGGVSAEFNPPLRGTANTLVEIACGTTGTATYFNLVGFTAAE